MGAFESGKYRNLFKEIGKTDEEIQQKIKEVVQTFFYDEEERIYHEAGEDMGYLTDTGNNDARTEGMSYGMMMCVQLDMKEEFDRIWKWSKTYMYMDEGDNEAILPGPVRPTEQRMPMDLHLMEKSFLQWLFSLLPIDGGMVKGYLTTLSRLARY